MRRDASEVASRVLNRIDGVQEQLNGLVAGLKREASTVATGAEDPAGPYLLGTAEAAASPYGAAAASDRLEEDQEQPPEVRLDATWTEAEAPERELPTDPEALEADAVEDPVSREEAAEAVGPDTAASDTERDAAEEPEMEAQVAEPDSVVEPERAETNGAEPDAVVEPESSEAKDGGTDAIEEPQAGEEAAKPEAVDEPTPEEARDADAAFVEGLKLDEAGVAEPERLEERGPEDPSAQAVGPKAAEEPEMEAQVAEPDSVVEPEPDAVVAPEPDAVVEPEPDAVVEPEPDAVVEPESSEAKDGGTDAIEEPQAGEEAAEPEAVDEPTPEEARDADADFAERLKLVEAGVADADSGEALKTDEAGVAATDAVEEPGPGDERAEPTPRRKRRILDRLRRPGLRKNKPTECTACAKPMVGSADELRAEGWEIQSRSALCPECQSQGWELAGYAQLPHRRP